MTSIYKLSYEYEYANLKHPDNRREFDGAYYNNICQDVDELYLHLWDDLKHWLISDDIMELAYFTVKKEFSSSEFVQSYHDENVKIRVIFARKDLFSFHKNQSKKTLNIDDFI